MSAAIFKPIFGDSWDNFPKAMKKHYANKPYSNDEVIVEGHLDVYCKWYLKPFFWLFSTVPPYNETDVPVTVHFRSQTNGVEFCLNRIFYFKNRKPFHFNSRMIQVKGNEVMERMNYGICWHSLYSWNGRKVTLAHKRYSFRIFDINILLPITWIIGAGNAKEIPIDDNSFSMCATIDHWLFGKVYEYKGQFRFTKEI